MEEIRQRSHSDNSCDRGNKKYRTGVAEAARRAPPAAESVRAGSRGGASSKGSRWSRSSQDSGVISEGSSHRELV